MNKLRLIVFAFFLWSVSLQAQTFQQFLLRMNGLPENARQSVADSFLSAVSTCPLVEYDTLVHFIYSGEAQSVGIAGDQTGWSPDINLQRISGTTFWYFTTHYEADARLDYKVVVNVNNWILDPRNPNTCTGGYGPNSELRMPQDPAPPEIVYHSEIAHGRIHDTTFYSSNLGNSRNIRIYLPPGYPETGKQYPLIVFHDGPDYLSLGAAANVLDYLISQGRIMPVIGIFVPPVNRDAEYAGAKIDLFTAFITEELLPDIDSRYHTSKEPDRRATLGASNGGNIALYIGIRHPEALGCIAAQSSNVIPAITSTLLNGPQLNLVFYLDIGEYDIPVLIPMVHQLDSVLTLRNYNHQMLEIHQGHSWGNWKEHLKIPLEQFFRIPDGINENGDQPGFRLEQNHPNPFRDKTLIRFTAPPGSYATLTLSTAGGKMVETIFSGMIAQSGNLVSLYRGSYAAGNYLCTLSAGGKTHSRVITIKN